MPIEKLFSSKLSTEQGLVWRYQQVIEPFSQQNLKRGEFSGLEGVTIAYAYALHPESIGSIVISSGRIESYIKYQEVIYDLYQNGYSVFIHDHRGQGLSGRMCDDTQLGYVLNFDDYVADFKTFMQQVVTPNSQHRPKLLCHSMGAAIGALYCLAYPEDVQQVVFCAPMFGIRPALPPWCSSMLLGADRIINALRGNKIDYFFAQKGYRKKPFSGNALTHSEQRYMIFRQQYEACPEVKLGGPTGQWLKAATEAMHKIEALAERFLTPALVIQAGADKVVDNRRQSRVCERLANSQTMIIAGAKHELLMEADEFRNQCLHATLSFYRDARLNHKNL